MPPWMSLLDRDDVPLAMSRASTSAVGSPRVTASSATPQPVIPPPMTRTSKRSSASRRHASFRAPGSSRPPGVIGTSPLVLGPVQRALHGLSPACHLPLAPGIVARRLPPAVLGPMPPHVVEAVPEADGEPRGICRAERGRLGDDGADDGDTEQIRLDLHEQVVDDHPAV